MKIHLEFEETELVKVRELVDRIGQNGKTEDFIEDLHNCVEEPPILDNRERAIEQFVDETKLTDSQKIAIRRLVDDGKPYQVIKEKLGLTNAQSRAANGLIQLHKRNLAKKASNKPVDEGRPPKVRTIRSPEEVAAIEATARHEADVIIKCYSGKSKPLNIANIINTNVGGNWLPDDVVKRQREMGLCK